MLDRYITKDGLIPVIDSLNGKLKKTTELPKNPKIEDTYIYLGNTTEQFVKGAIYQWSGFNWVKLTSTDYNDLSNKPVLGTASSRDVPSSGNASNDQVVLGNDTRLDKNYETLNNKPSINNVSLDGNKTTEDLHISYNDLENKPSLGTAAPLNVPSSGDADLNEVVLGSDTRLSDARPASDVYEWAKQANKPSYTPSEVGAIPATDKGANNGVAELDESGKVPISQLPSYVSDTIEGYLYNGKFYSDQAHTQEITPQSSKIYIDLNSNNTYRWSGSQYTEISQSLALGETSSTAYAGNKGKANADAIALINGKIPSSATTDNKLVTQSDLTTLGNAKNDKITISNDTTAISDESTFLDAGAGSNPTTTNRKTFSLVWTYIKNKISSVLGLTSTNYDGTAANATYASTLGTSNDGYTKSTLDEELGKLVPKTTTVNGHELSSNVSVTKNDVGLGSVANTGDSAVPVENGTTKFTTGGAYTELAKKADKSNSFAWFSHYSGSTSSGYFLLAKLEGNATTGNHDVVLSGVVYSDKVGTTLPIDYYIYIRGNAGTVGTVKFSSSKSTASTYLKATYEVLSDNKFVLRLYGVIGGTYHRFNTRIDYTCSGDVSARVTNLKATSSQTIYTSLTGTEISLSRYLSSSDVGLGNVGNFKAVSTVANQGLTTTEQSAARDNIGASPVLTAGQGLTSDGNTWKLGSGTLAHTFKTGTKSGDYLLITIKDKNYWMLSFKIRFYGGYVCREYTISGYNYNTSHWYSPTVMLMSSDGIKVSVRFGYDSNGYLWVAIPNGDYYGCDVLDVVNGHNQVTSFNNLFEITETSTLPGTTQYTKTIYSANLEVAAYCYTAASTAAKVATMPSYNLVAGSSFRLYLDIANTVANATLNVNGAGAKPIQVNGLAVTASNLTAGWYDVLYDGTNYQLRNTGTFILPVSLGGTGQTSQANINKAFIGALTEGTSDVTDGTMFVSSYASDNGFSDTNAVNVPYKRTFLHVWNYIKTKLGLGTGTTYLRKDGTWATPTDTKNTAGSTKTDSTIYLVGATTQAASAQTYSDKEVYTTNGTLTTNKVQVGVGKATMQYNAATEAIEFVFI